MTSHNFRSYSLQDTEKAINKRPFQESHSDLAEASLSLPDSPLQDIMNESEKGILKETEEEREEEIAYESEEDIEEDLEGEIAYESEEEITEEREEEIAYESEEEITEEREEEIAYESEEEIREEREEEIAYESEEDIEEDLEREIAYESEEEIKEELEGEIAYESEEEIKEELDGETLQEYDYPSDFEESPPDSNIQDIMKNFDEFTESEPSNKIDLQTDFLKEGSARTALEVNVNSVKQVRSQLEDHLKKAERADSRSGEDHQHHEDQQLASESKTPRSSLEDALNQQQKDADKLDNLTQENQQLASKNKRLQGELEDAVREMKLAGNAALSEQLVIRDKLDSLMRENQQVASVNKKLRSELADAVRERHVADISKQRELDDLTKENHLLASKSKTVQGELEDALKNIRVASEAAMIKHQEYTAKLDNVKMEKIQVVSENKRLQAEQKYAVQQHQEDREACSRLEEQVKKEKARFLQLNKKLERLKRGSADIESLRYDKETQCLQNNDITVKLEAMEAKYKETMSQKDEIRFKNQAIIVKNQQLASENKRLQAEQKDAVQQHQEDREACSRLEEQEKKEKARFLQLNKKLERLKRGSADIESLKYDKETLCLQNNDIAGKLEAMEAKYKETLSQQDDILSKNHAIIVKNQQLASENKRLQGELEEQVKKEKASLLQLNKKHLYNIARLKRGPADTEELMYDKETHRMENKYITVKLEAMEAKYELLVERDRAHSRRNEELLAQKDDVLSKNQAIKLQYIVDELRTQQSESKKKQAQLKDTLRQEQIQRAVLEERLSNTASTLEIEKKKTIHFAYALKTERAKSKRYSFELTEAKINQEKLQERQHLSSSLHNL